MTKEHSQANLKKLEEAFNQFLQEEQLEKSQPGSSDVHVPVAGEDDRIEMPPDSLDHPPVQSTQPELMSRRLNNLGAELLDMNVEKILHNGVPEIDDGTVFKIEVHGGDPKPILSEIQRVLMPGGQFVYHGPNDISNYPEWTQDYPGLVLTDHEEDCNVEKIEGNPQLKQVYTRIAVPDAATSDDAEPRTGVAQWDMLPADALLAADALGYYWSDSTSSGVGNRQHGYPSQGALVKGVQDYEEEGDVEKDELSSEGRKHIAEHNFALPAERKYPIHDLAHARNALARVSQHGTPEEKAKVQAAVYRKYPGLKERAEKEVGRRVATVAVQHKGKLLMGKRRDNGKWTVPGGHVNEGEDMHEGALRELNEETGIKAGRLNQLSDMQKIADDLHVQPFELILRKKPPTSMKEDPDGEVHRWQWIDVSQGLPQHIAQNLHVPLEKNCLMKCMGMEVKKSIVFKLDKHKQIVGGVVLEPNEVDGQGDWMTPEDIEDAAHAYLVKSRTVGDSHDEQMKAVPVESYINPVDYDCDTPYGKQTVKKGSWILAVKVEDPEDWQKVLDGEYTGFSVGGMGLRID